MDKVLLVLKVFLLVLTSEVLSVSVAETLFIALSEKLDNSLLNINERLDRLEQFVELNGFNTDKGGNVKDGMGKGKDIHSEIMKANKRFKKAMSHEKQHVRLMLEEYGNEFREVRNNVKHVLSEFNISMQATKDNMDDKMTLNFKAVQDRVTGIENHQDLQQSDMIALDNRVTTLHDAQENTIKKLEDRMTSSNNAQESSIKKLEDRMTSSNNAQKSSIKKLEDRLTSSNSQSQSEISSLANWVTTLHDAQKNTIKKLEDRMTSSNSQRQSDISSLDNRVTTLNERKVRFHVSLSTTRGYSSGSTIVFDHEVYNPESAYSTSTGKFTAPYTGTYLLSMSVEGTSNKNAFAALKDNGDLKMYAYANKGEDVISSTTCITYMVEGEQAWVESRADSEFWKWRTQFTGAFLY